MHAALLRWIDNNKPLIMPIQDIGALDQFIDSRWLTADTVRLYALVIGEGWRFPSAKQLFWEHFDQLWRKAFVYLSNHSVNLDQESIELHLDQQLMNKLRSL